MRKIKREGDNPSFQLRTMAPRLPRQIESDPRGQQLFHILTTETRPLWKGSEFEIPVITLGPELTAALRVALSASQLVRSLENVERTLAAEERGLRLVDRRSKKPRGVRISRLLLLADNGAERFYRQVESLLRRHGHRVLAVRAAAASSMRLRGMNVCVITHSLRQ